MYNSQEAVFLTAEKWCHLETNRYLWAVMNADHKFLVHIHAAARNAITHTVNVFDIIQILFVWNPMKQ